MLMRVLATIPKPPHWGGYVVEPACFEFWQSHSDQLHDRIIFVRQSGSYDLSYFHFYLYMYCFVTVMVISSEVPIHHPWWLVLGFDYIYMLCTKANGII